MEEKSSGIAGFFKGLKAEYRKIMFPTRQDIVKETSATIAVSFVIGLLIALLDLVMKTGLGYVLK